MAQTKKKRKGKHRGTPAGTIARQGRTGRPRTREEAKKIQRQRRRERLDNPPTWRGAVTRSAISAPILAVIAVLLLGWEIPAAIALCAFMFLIYIPLGYATDRAVYNFRRRRAKS